MPKRRFRLEKLLIAGCLIGTFGPVGAQNLSGCLFREYAGAVGEVSYSYLKADNTPGAPQTGTAFMINPQGYMLTAAHVVFPTDEKDEPVRGADKIAVTLGNTKLGATISKFNRELDVALLKVDELPNAKWKTIPIDKTGSPAPGSSVYALGYPGGFDLTVTPPGMVTSRNAHVDNQPRPWKQTSLNISPGMSGGPVFDASGAVVGIAVEINSAVRNTAYILPTSLLPEYLASAVADTAAPPCAERPQALTEETPWKEGEPARSLGLGPAEGFCFLTYMWGSTSVPTVRAGIFVPSTKQEFMVGDASQPAGYAIRPSRFGVSVRCLRYAWP